MEPRMVRGFKYPLDVRFKCVRCALCCRDTASKVRRILLLPEEVGRLSRITGLKPEEFAEPVDGPYPYTHELKKVDGACIFLRGNECTIYPFRPLVCRFYPFTLRVRGDEYVFEYTDECPGIGRGQVLGRRFYEELFKMFQKWKRLREGW